MQKKLFRLPFTLLVLFLVLNIVLLTKTAKSYARENQFRIITLAPNLTEIIYELNLEQYLVGASSFSDYPEAAKKIPQVGSYLQPQIEKIIKLKPTHVLVMKEGSPVIKEQLERAKITYLVFESNKLSDYVNTIQKISDAFKVSDQELIQKWNIEINKFKILNKTVNKTSNTKQKVETQKVLIQVDHNPIIIAGSKTFLSNALELCSLKNVFQTPGYANTSIESIMNKKPDVVIVIGQLNAGNTFKDVQKFYASNPALQNARIIEGDSDKLSRLTSRFLPEVFKVCTSLMDIE